MEPVEKIDSDYIIRQYQTGVPNYKNATLNLGLWLSEKYVFEKYLGKQDNILDVGCGTGRTTVALYQLGYTNITGVDLTPDMINTAKEICAAQSIAIDFLLGDATNLAYGNASFDAVVFSFNGIMSIPGAHNRLKAFAEISRVLKAGGVFVFTTHDRDADESFKPVWMAEKQKWDEGKQRAELYEFGDLITTSKNETGELFIHIPDMNEVQEVLKNTGFTVLETFWRPDKFNEPENVLKCSGKCRFWVAEKK